MTSSNTPMNYDHHLDATGLYCPEPVMMLHTKIRALASGNILKITATDPSTERDIAKFCSFLGHELLHSEEIDGRFIFFIRKG